MTKRSKSVATATATIKNLTWFRSLSAEELSKQCKKLSKAEIQELLISALARLSSAEMDMEALSERSDRTLRQVDEIVDDSNRLRNEIERLKKLLDATLNAYDKSRNLAAAVAESSDADMQLMQLGIKFGEDQDKD